MADCSNITPAPGASNIIIHPREQLRQMREVISQAAQKLIDILDWIDGDPDMEPSLGSVGASVTSPWATVPDWSAGATDDREEEHDGREPSEDIEPSLGSIGDNGRISQTRWASGSMGDYEEQCEDEGFDSDTELNGDEGDFSQGEDDFGIGSVQTVRDPKVLYMDKAGNVFDMMDGKHQVVGRLSVPQPAS